MEKSENNTKHEGSNSLIERKDYKKRLSICSDCPDSRFSFGVGLTCGYFLNIFPPGGIKPKNPTCGCVLSMKTKIKKSVCPQSKW